MAVAKTLVATVFSDENGTHIIDDHLPLIEAGMNVVNLIHYPFPSYWHTTYDTPKNCSVDSLSQVGNVILTLIYIKTILDYKNLTEEKAFESTNKHPTF